MLRKLASSAFVIAKASRPIRPYFTSYGLASKTFNYSFCSQKSLTPVDIPPENLKVKVS